MIVVSDQPENPCYQMGIFADHSLKPSGSIDCLKTMLRLVA